MKIMKIVCATVTVASAVALAAPSGAAVADATGWTVTAQWNMDESSPATAMVDSVGNHTGTIGTGVQTHSVTPTGFGYHFGPVGTFDRTHLVTVPDSADLNPGNGGLAITVVVKTGAGNQNILQKGQANQAGGYWKIDMNHGQAICLFRDGASVTDAVASKQTIWDGAYHTIRCERAATTGPGGVKIYVDGVLSNQGPRDSGLISNTKLLSIGGKYYCDGVSVGCDYFNGYIDSATIERS
jgi:concanavalin A-like lectin/glucanase superfamily protein